MPVSSGLPPFPAHGAFNVLREHIEQAKREVSDRAFLKALAEQAQYWRGCRVLIAGDDGFPAKKLSVEQKRQQRALVTEGVTPSDIDALLRWFDDAIQAVRRHARAA